MTPTTWTPRRFCDADCRRHFHRAVDEDRHADQHRPGHCWHCACTLPDALPEERYFLAHAAASPSYHFSTSYVAVQVGDLHVVGVELAELTEAMDRFFSGLHLADTQVFRDPVAAYEAAQAELRRRRYHRPHRQGDQEVPLRGTVRMVARAIDRDGTPALEVVMTTAASDPVPMRVIRTGVRNVREVDRALRAMGVRHATLIGARLWVDLGLPMPSALNRG